MKTRYLVQIIEEEDLQTDAEPIIKTVERFAIRVDDDPSKAIMRLLSAEKRGPRKGSKQAKQEAAK